MYKYGRTSLKRLHTCCPEIQDVANRLIRWIDTTIVCGKRGKDDQNKAFDSKASKVRWPNSRHNVANVIGEEIDGFSTAADVAPYVKGKGIAWDNKSASFMAGMFMLIAWQQGYDFTWGGDWDKDLDLKDQRFEDLCHFQYEGRLKR